MINKHSLNVFFAHKIQKITRMFVKILFSYKQQIKLTKPLLKEKCKNCEALFHNQCQKQQRNIVTCSCGEQFNIINHINSEKNEEFKEVSCPKCLIQITQQELNQYTFCPECQEKPFQVQLVSKNNFVSLQIKSQISNINNEKSNFSRQETQEKLSQRIKNMQNVIRPENTLQESQENIKKIDIKQHQQIQQTKSETEAEQNGICQQHSDFNSGKIRFLENYCINKKCDKKRLACDKCIILDDGNHKNHKLLDLDQFKLELKNKIKEIGQMEKDRIPAYEKIPHEVETFIKQNAYQIQNNNENFHQKIVNFYHTPTIEFDPYRVSENFEEQNLNKFNDQLVKKIKSTDYYLKEFINQLQNYISDQLQKLLKEILSHNQTTIKSYLKTDNNSYDSKQNYINKQELQSNIGQNKVTHLRNYSQNFPSKIVEHEENILYNEQIPNFDQNQKIDGGKGSFQGIYDKNMREKEQKQSHLDQLVEIEKQRNQKNYGNILSQPTKKYNDRLNQSVQQDYQQVYINFNKESDYFSNYTPISKKKYNVDPVKMNKVFDTFIQIANEKQSTIQTCSKCGGANHDFKKCTNYKFDPNNLFNEINTQATHLGRACDFQSQGAGIEAQVGRKN
ncbi:hypothetical protein PPERSA_06110 [Pseudocohnilembus persalinus]|uniref:Uncharacterized protein n=1 Tax=Pseudocohnilembus persalinus TaxID=266149 RepID=A0A0V0QVJ1_PSEPJ|nr:hypothetical protein PPERSA_06110 [Pseudocohnilembus persalinus]|eukprot:KRX06228.1 hypothetical protein PPERSA_06110 [Pseudocohnilembus persalinus]